VDGVEHFRLCSLAGEFIGGDQHRVEGGQIGMDGDGVGDGDDRVVYGGEYEVVREGMWDEESEIFGGVSCGAFVFGLCDDYHFLIYNIIN